jgi:hypothetical protein
MVGPETLLLEEEDETRPEVRAWVRVELLRPEVGLLLELLRPEVRPEVRLPPFELLLELELEFELLLEPRPLVPPPSLAAAVRIDVTTGTANAAPAAKPSRRKAARRSRILPLIVCLHCLP